MRQILDLDVQLPVGGSVELENLLQTGHACHARGLVAHVQLLQVVVGGLGNVDFLASRALQDVVVGADQHIVAGLVNIELETVGAVVDRGAESLKRVGCGDLFRPGVSPDESHRPAPRWGCLVMSLLCGPSPVTGRAAS